MAPLKKIVRLHCAQVMLLLESRDMLYDQTVSDLDSYLLYTYTLDYPDHLYSLVAVVPMLEILD